MADGFDIEERLAKHDEVLRSYREKFEEHKSWLQAQTGQAGGGSPSGMGSPPPAGPSHAQPAPGPAMLPLQVPAPSAARAQLHADPAPRAASAAAAPGPTSAAAAVRERAGAQPFRPAAQRVAGHPLRVYDRVTQWQRRREQRLHELRQRRENQELTDCTFVPTTRSPQQQQPSRMAWDPNPGATIYGGDGKAWGFHEFVERQREARRRSKEGNDGAFCTGKGWKNEITVPQEFQLGRRDRSIKALQKPLSPPTCVPSVGEHHHLAKELAALPKDSPLHVLQEKGATGWLPRAGLFSERISAKIIDYAMTQPGLDAGAAEPGASRDGPAPVYATPEQQMPAQGHFSQHGRFASGSSGPGDEWLRRSAEKRAIEEQLYSGSAPAG
eukprot:TRINITY_DN60306_c0_g1_i1.p1 TRINITY_DN60306_c0_g1~~TRINITY_DN60306_c0_g1_i1.p1  ORF type:complete len:420 (+),score=144.47 TRINITY_DN60306_c0_g1_i1:109-1260(+)